VAGALLTRCAFIAPPRSCPAVGTCVGGGQPFSAAAHSATPDVGYGTVSRSRACSAAFRGGWVVARIAPRHRRTGEPR
jgi:hypothetical protein